MLGVKVAVLGHTMLDSLQIEMPNSPVRAKSMLTLYNYTRVVSEDNTLIDHIAYLKKKRGIPKDEVFSVWEMNLCAGLLLTSLLSRNGIDCKLFNYLDNDNIEDVLSEIKAYQPDIIALSTTFVLTQMHMGFITKLLKEKFPEAYLVAGGHHVFTTLLHMSKSEVVDYIKHTGADCFVNDTQGETALLSLVQNFKNDITNIPNLIHLNEAGEVIFNPSKPEDNDINETLIDFDFLENPLVAHIRTARSCSFKCAFCSYPTIAGPLATMDLDNVFITLKKAKEAGLKALFFTDDTFNVPKERFKQIIDGMIEQDLQIPWYSFIRCQYLDESLVKRMKLSGCQGVYLGVESGSDAILKKMKKGAVSSFYRDGIRWLKEAGIVTVGSFIMGFPGETSETVEVTREFIENSGLDYYYVQPFYYLHHTPVHKRAEEYNLTGEGVFWSHSTMGWKEASEHVSRMFLTIKNSTFINPDYTLWEIAYLRAKGMSMDEIKQYRLEINQMTRDQMSRFDLTPKDWGDIRVTQRDSLQS